MQRVIATRNIGKQDTKLPLLQEGHVYEVSDDVAAELFKRQLAEAAPTDAPKAEKAPPNLAATTPVVETGPKPVEQVLTPTPSPSQVTRATAEDYDDWTVEDLHKEATARDIPNRGSMNKADLAKAIKADLKKKGK